MHMSEIIAGIRSVRGDVFKLVGGTTFSQVLGVLAVPILARLYGPECFGVAANFASIIGILTVVACLRYEMAILLPKHSDEAANVFGISLAATALTALLTGVVFMAVGDRIADRMKVPGLESYLWLIAPMVFLSGTFQALNYWNSRTRLYGRLAVARTVQVVIMNGSQIGFGFIATVSAGGLVWGVVLGTVAATTILAYQIWTDDAVLLRNSIQWKVISEGINRYRKFPLVDLWGGLLSVASQQLPIILLGVFFSQATVGHYAIASRLIYLPMTLIGGAVGQVFFQRAAEAHAKREDLAGLTRDVFKGLVTLILLPSLLLTLIGKKVFVLIFGPNWAMAGEFVQIFGPWMFFWFVASPLTAIFAVMQRLELALAVHALLLVARVAPLVIGGFYGGVYLTLTLYSLSGVVAYAVVGMWSMGLAGIAWSVYPITLGRIALRSLPAAALVMVLDRWLKAPGWLVLLAGGVGLLEYTWRVARNDPEINRYVSAMLGFLRRHAP